MSIPPLPGSGRAARMRRRKLKRIALLASLVVIILLLLCSVVLLAVQIAKTNAQLDRPDDSGDTTPAISDTEPNTPDANEGYTAFMYDSSKMHEGDLVLVNKDHKYTFPATPAHLSDVRSSRIKAADGNYVYSCDYDKLLDTEALGALNEMMADFYAATNNSDALITAAYRTAEDQDAMGGEIKGGYSDHHTGMLVTLKFYIDGKMYDTRDPLCAEYYTWLADNAAKYGFIVRYPDNKIAQTGVSNYANAYRYVGKAHAAYISANGLCLEEYVELLKSHNLFESHLSVTDSDGVSYEIYRIAASTSAQTSVQVPAGKQYTISGDNDGGFIVTVKLN